MNVSRTFLLPFMKADTPKSAVSGNASAHGSPRLVTSLSQACHRLVTGLSQACHRLVTGLSARNARLTDADGTRAGQQQVASFEITVHDVLGMEVLQPL